MKTSTSTFISTSSAHENGPLAYVLPRFVVEKCLDGACFEAFDSLIVPIFALEVATW